MLSTCSLDQPELNTMQLYGPVPLHSSKHNTHEIPSPVHSYQAVTSDMRVHTREIAFTMCAEKSDFTTFVNTVRWSHSLVLRQSDLVCNFT